MRKCTPCRLGHAWKKIPPGPKVEVGKKGTVLYFKEESYHECADCPKREQVVREFKKVGEQLIVVTKWTPVDQFKKVTKFKHLRTPRKRNKK